MEHKKTSSNRDDNLSSKKNPKIQKQPENIKHNHKSDKMIGPLKGIIAHCRIPSTRKYKTFESAYKKLLLKDNAVAIIKLPNGKYELRMAFHNDDDTSHSEYPFLYMNEDNTTWIRPEVLNHYKHYGPFTEQNPFDIKKDISEKVSVICMEASGPKEESDSEEASDISSPSTDLKEDEINYNEIDYDTYTIKGKKYFVFENSVYMFKYGEEPTVSGYTGKKYINNKIVKSSQKLPEIYIKWLMT